MSKKSASAEDQSAKKEKLKTFSIGDLAVYPAHGVGRIISIESRVVGGESHEFYIMEILENAMKIMIPVWNVEQVGLRDVIEPEEIPKVYEIMKDRTLGVNEGQTWNRRYREYMDKLKTGSLFDVAIVYRDLSVLKFNKDLSFGERKLFDTAQILLVKELSTAKKMDEDTVLSEIESMFENEDEDELLD